MGWVGPKAGRRHRASYWIRAALVAVAVVLLAPYLLAPLYRFVDPISTPMLWRWLTGNRVEHRFVPIESMAPSLPATVIIAEDARYCSHSGIDFHGLRGGSTITQQTAKNLFLWQRRSIVRKALEFPLALWIDLVLPKRRVLEIYLNVAEWGPRGEFGAEAAARRDFGKSVRDLTPAESALLVSALPNPARRNPQQPSSNLQRLAGIYEARAAAALGASDCVRRRRTP